MLTACTKNTWRAGVLASVNNCSIPVTGDDTHIAVYLQLQILCKPKAFDHWYVTEIEEPNVRQHLPGKGKPSHYTKKTVSVLLEQ